MYRIPVTEQPACVGSLCQGLEIDAVGVVGDGTGSKTKSGAVLGPTPIEPLPQSDEAVAHLASRAGVFPASAREVQPGRGQIAFVRIASAI